MIISQELEHCLPYMRRFARALTGNQSAGDLMVEACLEVLVSTESSIDLLLPIRPQIFKTLNNVPIPKGPPSSSTDHMRSGLDAVDMLARKALLLVVMEDFSLDEAAIALGVVEDEVESLIAEAQKRIDEEISTRIMIIEDEPLISGHLKQIIQDMGHEIVGIATTHSQATELANKTTPELIVADIQLADASSGIDAVDEIMSFGKRPVVFVTAFPKRLLTGEKPEPAFMVPKPFSPKAIRAIISQALFVGNRLDEQATR